MSAVERFSIAPIPARHALRALSPSASAGEAEVDSLPALIRLAERLLPGAVFLLEAGDSGPLRTWSHGMKGRRPPIDPLARVLLDHTVGPAEVWIANLAEDLSLRRLREVRDAGPLGFARLALPRSSEGESFGIIREAGEWTEEDRAAARDLAAALSGERDRVRLAGCDALAEQLTAQVDQLLEQRIGDLQNRGAEPIASVAPLLSGVCHELNNPLTSIKSFAELLLLDDRSEDDREALEIVQREAHRAARIVGDLRLVARQTAEASMRRDLVNLNEVVRQVLRARAQELRLEGIDAREELAANLPIVRGVRAHLEQVVSHLLSNAVKAMQGQDGTRLVTVATCRGGKGARLSVRDTGRGIAPESLGRIFEPLWTNHRGGEASGLGLSLVQSIVINHGGRVAAESQLGRGSVLTVEFPTADDLPHEVVASDEPPASQGLRVLVVDDEAPIRYSLARYMERRGHEVHQAADGSMALEMVADAGEAMRYDILIADLRMPGVDGETLLARLRERGDGLEQRVIFMTGDPQGPGAARLLQESGIPVMCKPFELAEVAQIIEAQARLLAV